MKILFMGTPDFAASVLDKMVSEGLDVIGAVSQPDRPKGRGHKLVPTDVKKKAVENGIAVYQPESLKDGAFMSVLDELSPDLIVVAAYGKILPEYIINYPRYGCINVHASILPKYRGAAPIQRAIINGDKETGVTIMKMDKGLDTGDILSVKKTPIGQYETAGELFDRLSVIGGELLADTVRDIENITPVKQNDAEATYAPMIKKDDGLIDWNKSAKEISKLICGMNPWPMAKTMYKGEPLKIASALICEGNGKPGELLELKKGEGLIAAAGEGAICIKEAQFSGSRRMNAEDYARGHEVEIGTVLGK